MLQESLGLAGGLGLCGKGGGQSCQWESRADIRVPQRTGPLDSSEELSVPVAGWPGLGGADAGRGGHLDFIQEVA